MKKVMKNLPRIMAAMAAAAFVASCQLSEDPSSNAQGGGGGGGTQSVLGDYRVIGSQ
jgi:hypothetical protein